MSLRFDGVTVASFLSNTVKQALTRSGQTSFWSTSERSQFDPTVEVLEINLNGERLINYLSFQLAHFPHLVSAEWYDREVGAWEPLRRGEIPVPRVERERRLRLGLSLKPTDQGEPLRHQIVDSMPVQVGTADSGLSRSGNILMEHPQHHGTDHWVPVTWRTVPVTTTRLRLLMVRGEGVPPALVTGGEAAYSLGVKDLQMGYRVYSKSDIPSAAEVTGTTFGSSVDLLGSRVTFSLRAQKASGVLAPQEGVAWRSEPQPVNYAVVNFYVDTRTGPQDPASGEPMPGDADLTGAIPAGQGQVIDRFYLDPLTVGAHLNLYHSNDEPIGTFKALDEPLTYPIAQEHGATTTGRLDPSVTTFDTIEYSPTETAYTDIDNTYLQFNPRKPWWLGMDLLSRTDSAGVAGGVDDHPWFSFGGNTLRQIGSTIEFVTASGKIASLDIDPGHMINAPFRVVVAFNPDAPRAGSVSPLLPRGLTVMYQFADRDPVEVTRDVIADDLGTSSPPAVAIGRYNDAESPGIPALGMRSLTLKVEQPVERDRVLDYFDYPRGFAVRSDSAVVDLGLTDNALLRAHPSYVVPALNPGGLVGGPGDRYAEMTWTPVHRDYVLRKGFLHIPPTRAKYWKFEFTQLVAEHYESFVPIRRAVKLFPSQTVEDHSALTAGSNWNPKNPGTPGIQTALDISDVNRYADAVGLLREASVDTSTSHTATEALYVRDPARAAQIAQYGWVWSYQPWHIGATSPKFVHTQRHEYETVTVEHKTKIGFFAGLKALQAYRLDYLVDDDTEQYDEHFLDRVNIESSDDVEWQDNRIRTYSSTASVTSKPFASKRPVRGVQFASMQSDAFPLLLDDGFRDEDLFKHWQTYGDAALTRLDDRTVRVNRGWNERTYGEMETEPAFDTYIEMDGHLYAELEGNQPNGLAGGGIVSEPVTPSASGRVYVAARVAAAQALSAPVALEIVSTHGDIVLASAERTVTAGQEEVFHIGYQVDSAVEGLTWEDMEHGVQTRTDLYEAAGGQMQFDFGFRVADPGTDLMLALTDGTPLVAPTDYSNVRYADATSTVLLVDTEFSIVANTTIVASLDVKRTYGSLDGSTYASHETQAIRGDVYARLTQYGRFADGFLIKRLSVFDAALTWEFSNDGGTTWWDGTDIRNNPEGVLMFPTSGTQLRWRMRSFHPEVSVSALAMRPWYGGLLGAVPGQSSNFVLGPNRSVVDDYPDIHLDPMWQQTDSPIPSYWYQPEPPEPVVVPEIPSEVERTDYYLQSQVLLESSRSGGWYNPDTSTYEPLPDRGDYYPFGPAAATILSDGTMFVAVQMFPNIEGGDTFYRMWHLTEDLSIIGVHDEPWSGADGYPLGDTTSIALAANDDGKVLLLAATRGEPLVETARETLAVAEEGFWSHSYVYSGAYYWSTTSIPADADHTTVGTAPVLASDDDDTYLRRHVVAGDADSQMIAVRLDAWSAPAGKVLDRLEFRMRGRINTGPGASASFNFTVAQETSRGVRNASVDSGQVFGEIDTPAPLDTWVDKDKAVVLATPWTIDRLATGDLIVGVDLPAYVSGDDYTFDVSFIEVVAVMADAQ